MKTKSEMPINIHHIILFALVTSSSIGLGMGWNGIMVRLTDVPPNPDHIKYPIICFVSSLVVLSIYWAVILYEATRTTSTDKNTIYIQTSLRCWILSWFGKRVQDSLVIPRPDGSTHTIFVWKKPGEDVREVIYQMTKKTKQSFFGDDE